MELVTLTLSVEDEVPEAFGLGKLAEEVVVGVATSACCSCLL